VQAELNLGGSVRATLPLLFYHSVIPEISPDSELAEWAELKVRGTFFYNTEPPPQMLIIILYVLCGLKFSLDRKLLLMFNIYLIFE
jgi:hypothetical protein